MRTSHLLGLAAISLLAAAGVARAQPSLTAPATAPATPPTPISAYLEPGIEAGATWGALYGAIELDGGYRLGNGPVWLHSRLAQGGLSAEEGHNMSSDFTEARIGAEVRGCVVEGIACLVGGLDLGYRHEMLEVGGGRETLDLGVAVARLGLDLGGDHLRFRPSVELSADQTRPNGIGFTAGIAYTW